VNHHVLIWWIGLGLLTHLVGYTLHPTKRFGGSKVGWFRHAAAIFFAVLLWPFQLTAVFAILIFAASRR
jgi:hypothetical protein